MKQIKFAKKSTLTKIAIWAILAVFSFGFHVKAQATSPNITVNWNGGDGINAQDVAPGADYTKTASVINNSPDIQKLAIQVTNLTGDVSLADLIGFQTFVGANSVLSENFKSFTDKTSETYLSDIVSNQTLDLSFILDLDENAGNDYQNKNLGFDLTIGYIGSGEFAPLSTFSAQGNEQVQGQSTENQEADQGQGDKNNGTVAGDQTKEAGVTHNDYTWIFGLIAVFLVLLWGLWLIFKKKKKEEE